MTKVYSSSRIESYFRCPQQEEWNYSYRGLGVVPIPKSIHLEFGIHVHQGIEDIISKGAYSFHPFEGEWGFTVDGYPIADEMSRLSEGLLYTFQEIFLPTFLQRYEILGVPETELVLRFGNIIWSTRPDLFVRDLMNGNIYNVNYKTSGYPSKVFNQYKHSIQAQMEAYATGIHSKSQYGQDCAGTILIVLDKGSRRDGRQNSPFTYNYIRERVGGPPEIRYKWTKGFEKVPAWVYSLPFPPREVIHERVFSTTPIDLDLDEIERIKSEVSIISELPRIRRRSNCLDDGGYGYICPYYDACWVDGEPTSDKFKQRVPHHPIEMTIYEEGK